MIKNKNILILSIISIVTILSVGSFFVYQHLTKTSELGPNSVPADSNFVEDTNQPLTNGTTPKEDKVLTPTPPNDSSSVEKPTITRAEVSGDYVRVSAILSKTSNGTCTLNAKSTSGGRVTKTADIVVGPSYYTCDGFRINKSEFSSGNWDITVTHTLNGKTTTSEVRTINVN